MLVTAAMVWDRYDSVPMIPFADLTAEPVAFRRLVERVDPPGQESFYRPRSISRRAVWTLYADELGRGLWLANAASVDYRYRDATSGAEAAELRAYRHQVKRRDAVAVIKACHCFAYQACETPDWELSQVARQAGKAAGYDSRIEAVADPASPAPGYERRAHTGSQSNEGPR